MENINTIVKVVGAFIIVGIFAYMLTSKGNSNLGGDNEVIFSNRTNEVASSSYSVAGTAVQVLARNAGRIYARCANFGAPNVSLAMGGNASKQWGVLLGASQSYEFTKDKNLYLGPVYAITLGGTTRVSCVEASGR